MKRQTELTLRHWIFRAALVLVLALVVAALAWCRWVYVQIDRYAGLDQVAQVAQAEPAAQLAPADAIVVFGAAEYDGRPSPVYRARLDHGLSLFHHGIAPLLITLGGNGGDQYNEGAVGREYLMGMGVPRQAIIAETVSRNTEESALRVSVIARANGLHRLVLVSDGTHLFRIHEICAADGLDVLTSPRPHVAVEGETGITWRNFESIAHEILSYTAWRLHLH
jgi:vancomycin permeability regulator SanA